MRLELAHHDLGCDRTVVTVVGEIDLESGPHLRRYLLHLLDTDRQHLVLDLTRMVFIDSSGLGVLVTALRAARARDGSVVLVLTARWALSVFAMTGLDRLFTIRAQIPAPSTGLDDLPPD